MSETDRTDAAPDSGLPPSDPPGYGPPPAPRRIYRSVEDRKIGGVCAGVGQYFGIDPTFVRLAFVLAAFAGGAGLIVYVAAWILLPEGEQPVGARTAARSSTLDRNTAIALLLLFGAVIIGVAGPFGFGEGIMLPLALIGGGVFLLTQRPFDSDGDDISRLPPPPPTAAADETAGTATSTSLAPYAGSTLVEGHEPTAEPPAPAVPPAPPLVPPEPRRPAIVTRLTLSIIALVVAGAIAAAAGDWFDVSIVAVVALCLAIIGAGLLIGAFVGGARGLIVLGLIAALVLLPAAGLAKTLDGGIGEKSHRPIVLADLQTEYTLGIGELVVDLSALDLEGESRSVRVDLGIGEARVIVPADATVIGTAHVGLGEAQVFDQVDSGGGNDVGPVTVAGPEGGLVIDLDVGIGHGEIRRG